MLCIATILRAFKICFLSLALCTKTYSFQESVWPEHTSQMIAVLPRKRPKPSYPSTPIPVPPDLLLRISLMVVASRILPPISGNSVHTVRFSRHLISFRKLRNPILPVLSCVSRELYEIDHRVALGSPARCVGLSCAGFNPFCFQFTLSACV